MANNSRLAPRAVGWISTTWLQQLHRPLGGHVRAVKGLHFTQESATLVSVSEDGGIRRWDPKTGREWPHPDGYTGPLRMAFSRSGRQIAVADADGRVDVWETATGERLRTLCVPDRRSRQLAFLPDGQALLTVDTACMFGMRS